MVTGLESQIRLGSDTIARFVKNGKSLSVVLEKGLVSIFSAKNDVVKVEATGVGVTSASGFKTIGHIALLGGAPMVYR